jgi:hypothetical protein
METGNVTIQREFSRASRKDIRGGKTSKWKLNGKATTKGMNENGVYYQVRYQII